MTIATYTKLLPEGGSGICLAPDDGNSVLARFYGHVVVAGNEYPTFMRHRQENWRRLTPGEETKIIIGDHIRIDVSEKEPSIYVTIRHKTQSIVY